jgi:uncharacterized protein (DUF1697 family)
MTTYAAFLRGVNVGGKSIVSMAELKSSFESLGYTHVTTYINSGNIIFHASGDPRAIERDIEAIIYKRFKIHTVAMVRTHHEMLDLLEHVPEEWLAAEGYTLEFLFLGRDIDSPEILKQITPKDDMEELLYFPGALLWHFATDAKTRSSVLKINTMPLYQQISVRTSGTVRKLTELMQ